jgi:hypothetical protein
MYTDDAQGFKHKPCCADVVALHHEINKLKE